MSKAWNNNIYYHNLILNAIPQPCIHALDVGCGDGLLSRELALHCGYVTGIDLDTTILSVAKAYPNTPENITYLQGNIMSYPFPKSSFNLITLVAALHHLPLYAAIVHLKELLAPGGVLEIIGLYKQNGIGDFIRFAAAFPISWLMRLLYSNLKMDAPIAAPKETLAEIKFAAAQLMPGAVIRRHFFYRYSLTWRKPK